MLSKLFSLAFTQLQALMEQTDDSSLVLVPSRPELHEDFALAFKAHVQESGRKAFAMKYAEKAGPGNFGAYFPKKPDFNCDEEDRKNLRSFIESDENTFDQALTKVIGLVSVNSIFARRIKLHEKIINDFCSQAIEYQQSVYIIYSAELTDTTLFNIVSAVTAKAALRSESNFCFVLIYDESSEANQRSATALKTRFESNGVEVSESRILMPTPMEIVDFLSWSGARRDAALAMSDEITKHYLAKETPEYIAGSYVADPELLEMMLSTVGAHIPDLEKDTQTASNLSTDRLIESIFQCNLAMLHRHIEAKIETGLGLAEMYLGLNLLYFMETPVLRTLREKAQKMTFKPFGIRIACLYASLLASPKQEMVKPLAMSLLDDNVPIQLTKDAAFACCLYTGFFVDTATFSLLAQRLEYMRSYAAKGYEDAGNILYAVVMGIGSIIKHPESDPKAVSLIVSKEWQRIKDSGMHILKYQVPRLISMFQYSIVRGTFLEPDEVSPALDKLADLDFETQSIATSPSSSIMSMMYVAGRYNQKKQYAKAFGLYRQAKNMSQIFRRSENERAASLRLWEIAIRSGFEFEDWEKCRFKMDGETKANAPDFQFHACEIKTLFIKAESSDLLKRETEALFAYLTKLGVNHADYLHLWDVPDMRRMEETGRHLTFQQIADLYPSMVERQTVFYQAVMAVRSFVQTEDMTELVRVLKDCCDQVIDQDAFSRTFFLGLLNTVRKSLPEGALDDVVVRLVDTWVNDFMSGWTSFEDRCKVLQSRLSFPYFSVADIIMHARKAKVLSVMHKTADSIEDEKSLCFVIAFGLLIYSRAVEVRLTAHRKEHKICVLDSVAVERDLEKRTVRVSTESKTCEQTHKAGIETETTQSGAVVVAHGVAGAFDVSMRFTPSFPKEAAMELLKRAIADERYFAYLTNQHRKILHLRRFSDATEHFNREKIRFSKNYRDLYQLAKEREREVFLKTRDIQSILDNIQVGIFSVSDSVTYQVDSDHSQHLLKILGIHDVENQTINSLLLDHCELDPYKKSMIGVCLSASLGEHRISFEFNSDQLPRELIYKRHGHQQILELDWNVVMSSDDQVIRKILISLRDVTELREYQQKNRQQQQEMTMIQEILNVAPAKFSIFRTSLEKFCSENHRQIESMTKANDDAARGLRMLYINLHTIKGNSISLGLKALATMVHDCEDRLQSMQRGETNLDCEILKKDNDCIRSLMDSYVKVAKEKLNRSDDAGEIVSMRRSDLQELTEKLLKNPVKQDISLLVGSAYISATYMAEEVRKDISRLAKDLEKAPPHLTGKGLEKIYFTHKAFEPLNHALMHLLRNCMDHGIESPEERREQGKEEAGRLEIKVEHQIDKLTVRLSDDGRGLALARIRKIAVSKGLLDPEAKISPEQTAELIFSDGFSTAAKVTDISGRGVGMGAVREFMKNLGGSLSIRFTGRTDGDFAPFEFVLEIPSCCFVVWEKEENLITVGYRKCAT